MSGKKIIRGLKEAVKHAARYCSFCGRSGDEVGCLVSGPSCFICNECAESAVEIAKELLAKGERVDRPRPFSELRAKVQAEQSIRAAMVDQLRAVLTFLEDEFPYMHMEDSTGESVDADALNLSYRIKAVIKRATGEV